MKLYNAAKGVWGSEINVAPVGLPSLKVVVSREGFSEVEEGPYLARLLQCGWALADPPAPKPRGPVSTEEVSRLEAAVAEIRRLEAENATQAKALRELDGATAELRRLEVENTELRGRLQPAASVLPFIAAVQAPQASAPPAPARQGKKKEA